MSEERAAYGAGGFKPAERKQAKLRLAVTGPSGSGKTYSSLLIASGLGKKIALVDSENKSASLYADKFKFDTMTLEPPYEAIKYIRAIEAAENAGYDVLIIDSISHQWVGEGGSLDRKSSLDARGGNSFTNWASITKDHEAFKARLNNCRIHLIATMRSKTEYVLEQNDKGKSVPKKLGLAPIQRDGMDFEFDLVLDIAMTHEAAISKSRIESFDGRLFKPTKKTGQELLAWLNEGKAPEAILLEPKPAEEAAAPVAVNTVSRVAKAIDAFVKAGVTRASVEEYIATLPFKDDEGIANHLAKIWTENSLSKAFPSAKLQEAKK